MFPIEPDKEDIHFANATFLDEFPNSVLLDSTTLWKVGTSKMQEAIPEGLLGPVYDKHHTGLRPDRDGGNGRR